MSSAKDYLTKTFNILEGFRPFNQKYDIFNRSIWDDSVNPRDFYLSYDVANYKPKKAEGFDHWDFALRNASWHLADLLAEDRENRGISEGFTHLYEQKLPGAAQPIELESPEDTSRRIKKAAKMLGASLVGICEIDRRWLYSHRFDRKVGDAVPFELPSQFSHAIILVSPMDGELSKIVPSAIGGASTGKGYADSIVCANALSQFILNLGYEAEASLNDSGLAIPMAIQAGLGEYGRNGLLITKEFGPRIRISKVFTNLPMAPDQPIEFGVKAFCDQCNKCADACPVKAIPKEKAESVPPNISSFKHITKWTINAEKCFGFWTRMNTDCAICIRVCPYNKDYSKWWNRLGQRLAGTSLRGFMLWLDNKLEFGKRKKPSLWWKS